MKSLGIVRKLDELGRVVLPKELRKTYDLDEGVSLEIFVDGKYIMLAKYEPGCIFCGDVDDVISHKGKRICNACLVELNK